MIASIIGTGSFLDASGKPTPKLIVRLEMLTVTDSWRTIAQSQTNEKGEVKMKAAGGELRELTVVPTTRLVDERGNMLTENPVVTVSRNELTLDFGETVRGLSTSVLGTRAIIPTLATGNLKINKRVNIKISAFKIKRRYKPYVSSNEPIIITPTAYPSDPHSLTLPKLSRSLSSAIVVESAIG